MTIKEISKTLNYLLDNNLELVKQGLPKLAISLEGFGGVGKTSIVKEIAEKRGCFYKRLNLSELEEVGDLCGIPIKTYKMVSPELQYTWIPEKAIKAWEERGYSLCGDNPRMEYAIPEWIPSNPEQEAVLVLDDYNRCRPQFANATMSLIQFGEYSTWKLPKNCHIILTQNPEDGNFNNESVLDSAQKSRFITFKVDFDEKVWAEWADNQGIREEFINFALIEPTIFQSANLSVNARNYTMFANACYGIRDLGKNLPLINNIAKATFGDEEYISSKFCTFINNNLDKLPTPEDILKKDFDVLYNILHELIYKDGYRADITFAITFRFINYVNKYLAESTEKDKTKKVIDRIVKLVEISNTKDPIIMSDLIFILAKKLYAKNPASMAKLLINPIFRNKLIND